MSLPLIQELKKALEQSKQARLRAWEVLQQLRATMAELGLGDIAKSAHKSFEKEGQAIEKALRKAFSDRTAALRELADAARRVDHASFGDRNNFGPSHQALLKALDNAERFLR